MRNLAFSTCMVCFLLCACSEEQAPSQEVSTRVVFEKLILPGSLADAKKMGFTDCSASYYYFECRHPGAVEVFGAKPLSLKIHMDGKNNLTDDYYLSQGGDARNVDPSKLTYRSIFIEFSDEQYSTFKSGLRAAGWIENNLTNSIALMKEGLPAEVSIRSLGSSIQVAISPKDITAVNEELSRVLSSVSEHERKNRNADAVINLMKQ